VVLVKLFQWRYAGRRGLFPDRADNQQESSILCDIWARAGRLGKDQSKAIEEVQAKEKLWLPKSYPP